VPTGGWGYHWGNGPAWDSAYPLICWYLYQYYGDTRVLEEHYDNLKRYVDYVSGRSKDRLPAFGLGDWLQLKQQTPVKLTSSGYFYVDALILSKMAKVLGRVDDESQYAELATEIKAAFLEKYYNKETGMVHRGSQTALSCAIYQGLVEDERTVKHLVENVKGTDGHLNCGFLGAKYLLHALPPEIAYTVAAKTTYPSWGHWIEKGATTLWEDWKGENSLNHIAFGDISAWFYQVLAGIRPGKPGFEHIEIRPNPVGDLTWVKAEYESIRGKISSHWKIEGGVFTLVVAIPPNCTAKVRLPKGRVEQVGSGTHEFAVK